MDSIDKNIFLFLNRLHTDVLDQLMFSIRNLLLWIPLCFLLLFIVFRYYRDKRNYPYPLTNSSLIFIFILLQTVICIIVLPPFFNNFQEVRPCYNSEFLPFINFSHFTYVSKVDFFSAKVCAVLAVSIFFIFSYPDTPKWMKFILVIWAIMISYNRIYIGAHYPSNILINNALGFFIGFLTWKAYNYLKSTVLVI